MVSISVVPCFGELAPTYQLAVMLTTTTIEMTHCCDLAVAKNALLSLLRTVCTSLVVGIRICLK